MARRERNIYKRKDGRYEGRYIKGRDSQGKALYGAVYAHSYNEVKAKLHIAREKNKIPQTIVVNKKIVMVSEEYLETMKTQIKQSTREIYRRYIYNHIAPYFGNVRCDQLDKDMVQNFVNAQHESGLSAMTVKSVFCFFRKSVGSVTAINSFDVKLPKHGAHEVIVLSAAEQKQLEVIAMMSDEVNFVSIILCLYTGIRIGELCGLMWSDLDYNTKLLHIRRTSQRIKDTEGTAKTKLTFLLPKTSSSTRSIPLPEFLIKLLKEHQSRSNSNFIISQNNNAVEPRCIQYKFKRLLQKSNLRIVNFHTLRHTFSVRALENGFDVKTLSEILGHSTPVTTLTRYAHVLDEHKRRSMESLGLLFNS